MAGPDGRAGAGQPVRLQAQSGGPQHGANHGACGQSHYLFCAAALGESEPQHPDYEKATDKATLLAGMNESVAYCERAYQITDGDAMKATQFFGSTITRLAVLVWNATHDGEHYGNLVVYMRANGMVPPSSQGGN